MKFCLSMLLFAYSVALTAQSDFNDLVGYFNSKNITDSIFDIYANKTVAFLGTPTIPLELYNNVMTSIDPKYYLLNGEIKNIDYLGQIDASGFEYTVYDANGNELSTQVFIPKLHPLAKITLNTSYATLLFSVRHIERTTVYMLNFTSSGTLLSGLILLTVDASLQQDAIFVEPLYNFDIEPDGKIFQTYEGLDFYRERRYELRSDGCFQVVWENIIDR